MIKRIISFTVGVLVTLLVFLTCTSCKKEKNTLVSSCVVEQGNYDSTNELFTEFNDEAISKGYGTLVDAQSEYNTSDKWDQQQFWCIFATGFENGHFVYQDSINTYPRTTVVARWEDLEYENTHTYNLLQNCLQ